MTTSSKTQTQILDWIARIGAASAADVASRFDLSLAQARARLQAAQRARTIEAVRLLHDHPALYVASAAGLRLVGLADLTRCRVSPGGFAHLTEVARAAVALELAHPDLLVVGERELRRWEADSGRWLASADIGRGPDGFPARHRPDLVIWPAGHPGLPSPAGHPGASDRSREPRQSGGAGSPDRQARPLVAIEVELTVKAPRRLATIIRGWARTRLVGAVVYYATPAAARAVGRAVEDQQAGEIVHVLPIEQVGTLPTEVLARSPVGPG